MSDEQTIYIGPEDDLTSVRERLERISSRHVTLVLPAQTQLRSHVAWKLLHARARELGKDVLIVSSDPQIRSVAQAVKFRVVPSLEASSAGVARSRPTNRPTRANPSGRSRSSTRVAPSRETSPSRSTSSGRLRPQPVREEYPQAQSMPQTPLPQEQVRRAEPEETLPRGLNGALDLPADPSLQEYNSVPAVPFQQAPPENLAQYIHPITPEQIEEPDHLVEDFDRAREIEAASRGGLREMDSTPSAASRGHATDTDALDSYRMTPIPHVGEDPFAFLEDSRPSRLPEQYASARLDDFDTGEYGVQDVSDLPTEVTEPEPQVEDLGDQDVFPLYDNSPRPLSPAQEEEQVRNYGAPRSRSTTGSAKQMPVAPRRQDFEGEDELPPVADRPTQITPQAPVPIAAPAARATTSSKPLSSKPLSSKPLASKPLSSKPLTAQAQRRPPLAPPQRSREVRLRPPLSQPGARSNYPSRPSRQRTARRRSISGSALGLIVVLFFLLIGALAYFGPTATVTLTLPARNYAHAIKLTAVPKDPQRAAAPGTVYADVLTKDFTRSGTGTATGSAKVNTAQASGSVIFTNTGQSFVTIPSGVVVSTPGPNSQPFATTAEAVVLPPGSSTGNSIEIPIQAQQPGNGGNVAAGTITVIPDDSLNQIAKANNVTPASLKLQVSNPRPTTGGGVGNATVISHSDLDNVTKSLQSAMSDDINAWVQQQKPSSLDVAGPPAISGSLLNPPHEGQVVTNGTFPAQYRATVTLMIVRSNNLQGATIAQLKTYLNNDKNFNGFTINPDPKQPVSIQSLKTSGQGTSFTLAFTAVAKTIPNISQDDVRKLVAGKLVADAVENLKSLRNVEAASVKTSPGFIFWVSSLPSHINVNLIAGPSQK